jgi:anti-sigma B factor antagonist
MSSKVRSNAPPVFCVTASHIAEQAVVVLSGELDLATAPQLRARLAAMIENGEKQIVLDLTGLEFIDSTGLSVLVMVFKRTQAAGGSMVIRNPSSGVTRIFEITGLSSLFAMGVDEEALPSAGV